MTNRLKQLRQEKKLSQEECAQNIGISVRTLQRCEQNNYIASIFTLSKISAYFNVSMEELLSTNTRIKDNQKDEKNFN